MAGERGEERDGRGRRKGGREKEGPWRRRRSEFQYFLYIEYEVWYGIVGFNVPIDTL